MIAPLLDLLLGPRAWCVIIDDGSHFAVLEADTSDDINVVVARSLREGQALRKARALRYQAQETPQALF